MKLCLVKLLFLPLIQSEPPLSALSPQLQEVQKIILDDHNKYRRKANPIDGNVQEMIWSTDAADRAEEWAKQCKEGHSPPNFSEIKKLKCVDNVFHSKSRLIWDYVIDTWSYEINHYSRLPWDLPIALGCGIKDCTTEERKIAYVCNYCWLKSSTI
ncbi:cysteine-rich venom protein kaouthin-2-like isoform X2 [Engystomops pustulosus]|uniref:cysteine-rich venom protein kaouthin-2-like isoform X2 n=1 Tax=Engystomops pustulosus TaxID=76066 RepID=UPI003AFAEEAB